MKNSAGRWLLRFVFMFAFILTINWVEGQYAASTHPDIPYMGVWETEWKLGDGHYEVVGKTLIHGHTIVIRHDPGGKDFLYVVHLSRQIPARFRIFLGQIM